MTAIDSSRQTASEFVADTLRREILRGEFLSGQPLLQDKIAARFEVSQSSVREALRRLEAIGLVTSIRNRGTFVTTLRVAQVEEMYDVRLAVELLGFRSNFGQITREQLQEAERLLEIMEKDPDAAFLGEAHKRFHAIFYESADRTLSKEILQNIYGNLTRLWVDFIRRKPTLVRRFEEETRHDHRILLDTVKARDLAKAETILTLHVNRAREILVSHMKQLDEQRAAEPATQPDTVSRAGIHPTTPRLKRRSRTAG